ncbi:SURF1 family cytochrome oxidase biogenesis protein, partial [Klebsiella pneumoniae]|uniref:SURF1 family cytochrome oxidase biogenesis protein n=2 Tax=Pseudomonadota TaxID=1224 RepID=UPI0019532FD9
LGEVAPYFIDRDAGTNARDLPIGGLTVIRFPNNHLVYAITWFALALMLAAALIYVGRYEWQVRKTMRLNQA